VKIYIDSANLDEIKEAFSWGIVDGITTNPSLIKKAVEHYKNKGINLTMEEYVSELLKEAGLLHPVSLEVIGNSEGKMVEEAEILFRKFDHIAHNVVIKIPVNPETEDNGTNDFDGLKAIKKLHEKGINVNATLIMSPSQALLAAKAGAKYLSPFSGRIDDYLRTKAQINFKKDDYYPEEGLNYEEEILNDDGIVSGVDLVASIKEILENYDFKAEIIAASVRNPRQVRELAEVGAHIATIPFDVIKLMIKHPKTLEGMINFTKDTVSEYKEIFK